MPPSFDLRTQPFIPCLCKDGQVREFSLIDVLSGAHELRELAGDTPLQTIAILRLLLAILYRAMPFYDYEEEKWVEWWRQGTLPADAVTDYLNAQDGFDLFHATHPFMQVAGLDTGKPQPMTTLAFEAASGNNATLFDHSTDKTLMLCSPAQAARMLITAQAFSVAGGAATEVLLNNQSFSRPNRVNSPAWAGMNLFLSGMTLVETLLLNMKPLAPNKPAVLPIWEHLDPLTDTNIPLIRNEVDRYTWQSRFIKLLPDSAGFVSQIYITQGRVADNAKGNPVALDDPMKVLTSDPKKGYSVKYLNADRAAWRDLQVYLAFGKAYENSILHFVGEHIQNQDQPDEPLETTTLYSLNIIGVVSDQAKIDLWRHERMSLPAALLASDALRGFLETGMGDAEAVADTLRQRMWRVVSLFLPPDGNPDPEDVKRWLKALNPQPAFWARLETHFAHFLTRLATEDTALSALTEWRKNVEREASHALHESCNQLGDSTRAMKAVATVTFGFVADRARLAQLAAEAKARKKTTAKRTGAPA